VRQTVVYSLTMRFACFFVASLAIADTAPISDENLRMGALHAIFPGMQISLVAGKRIDDSWPKKPKTDDLFFPDALAKENVYRVIGKPMNEVEQGASEDVASLNISTTRVLRFQLFRWPSTEALVAVLQYSFVGVFPALACQSIGLLAQLTRVTGGWRVEDHYLFETGRHTSLQAIRLIALGEDGAEDLVIESNFGGPGTSVSELLVFDLSHPRFEEVVKTNSRFSGFDGTYTQVLDVPKTSKERGQQFCFTKATMIENDIAYRPPRIASPCYNRGEGVTPNDAAQRNKMLVPLPRP
jgi:hypothetical protein